MNPCPDCAARRVNPRYTTFDPACAGCGADALRFIRGLALEPKQRQARTQHVLDTWSALGHDKAALLSAAKG